MENYHKYMKVKDTVNSKLVTKKVDNLFQYCSQNQIKFKDSEFPPEKKSLIGNPPANDYQGQWEQIGWARAEHLFGDDYDVFRGISPNDIQQGALGNCYFLCSLASMAEYPELVKRLFDFDTVNEYGIHSVWLNINGIWRQIVLDEYFPTHGRGLAFSKTDQRELWVILLEKAYAKVYGSYWEIVGGDPVHALRDLTGAPYDRIEDEELRDLDGAWAKLTAANQKMYMLTCFTKSTEITEEKHETGIVSGHAYTILDVRNVIDSQGQSQRLVCIRNPWGKFEWNGAFSDNSPLWTDELRRELNVRREDDGIFWMRLEDFVQYYQGVGILEIIPHATQNGLQISNCGPKEKKVFRMDVKNETNMMFSVDQQDTRFVDNPNYSYSYFRVTIGKLLEDNSIQFIDSVLSPERNIFLENKLTPGTYVALVEPYFSNNVVNSFNVGTYSEETISLQLLKTNNSTYHRIEYLIWKDYCRKNYQKMTSKGSQNVSDGYNQAQVSTYQLQNQKFANVLYNYMNHDQRNAVHKQLRFTAKNGFDVVGQQCTQQQADLLINPQDNDILLFKMDPRAGGFSLSFQTTGQEVMTNRLTPDVKTFELLKNLGGTQPTPDEPEPKLISRVEQREQEKREREREEQLARLRAQQKAERERLMREKERKRAEERARQEQYLRQRGLNNDTLNSLFGFFGQSQPQQNDGWGMASLSKLWRRKKKKRQQDYDPYSGWGGGGGGSWGRWGQQISQYTQGYGQQQQQGRQKRGFWDIF